VFLPGARFREVAVAVLYVSIGSTVAELPSDGRTACGGPGRFFFDDAFVLVTVVVFDHGSIGMIQAGMPLYLPGLLLVISGRFGIDAYPHTIELAARFSCFRGLRIALDQRTQLLRTRFALLGLQ
jgi:hypothetical protein